MATINHLLQHHLNNPNNSNNKNHNHHLHHHPSPVSLSPSASPINATISIDSSHLIHNKDDQASFEHALDYNNSFNSPSQFNQHYNLPINSPFVTPPHTLSHPPQTQFSLSPIMALPSPSISPSTFIPPPNSATAKPIQTVSKNSSHPSPQTSRTSGFFASTSSSSLNQLIRPPPSLRAASYSSPSPQPHYTRHAPMTADQLCESPPSSPVGAPTPDAPPASTPPPKHPAPATVESLVVGATLLSPRSRKSYTLVRKLGEGSFSTVFAATSSPTTVALKLVRTPRRGAGEDERMTNSVEREVEILKRIRHPSVVELIEEFVVEQDGEEQLRVLVLEHVMAGELFELVGTHGGRLRASVVGRLLAELCTAVGWMHSVGLVHRDIKLENLLLTRPITNTAEQDHELLRSPAPFLKVTDLGLARFVGPTEKLATRCGSEEYAAPEIILGRAYDGRQTDCWAVGVVGFALVTGELPFAVEAGGGGRKKGLARIVMGKYEWKGVSEAQRELLGPYMSLVEGLLRRETKQRERLDGFWDDKLRAEQFVESVKLPSEKLARCL